VQVHNAVTSSTEYGEGCRTEEVGQTMVVA
jgi:hypothetical protein